jgi:hypothetical protein
MESGKFIVRLIVVLLLIMGCSQVYFFVSLHSLQTSGVFNAYPSASASRNYPASTASTTTANTVIGNDPVAYQGYITQIQNGSMQVKTPENTVAFGLSSDTKFFTPGTQKSNVEFNQEMVAYNAKVSQLMQDPVTNAQALKAMTVPSQFNQTTLSLSDFKVGDYVFVTPGTKNSARSYAAVSVALANAAAPTPSASASTTP